MTIQLSKYALYPNQKLALKKDTEQGFMLGTVEKCVPCNLIQVPRQRRTQTERERFMVIFKTERIVHHEEHKFTCTAAVKRIPQTPSPDGSNNSDGNLGNSYAYYSSRNCAVIICTSCICIVLTNSVLLKKQIMLAKQISYYIIPPTRAFMSCGIRHE
jgi:hypothetical protein